MSKIKINEITDSNFGKCVVMDNGIAQVHVTLDFGPRIIYYALNGQENVLYQDVAKGSIGEVLPPFDEAFKLYGGHRLWVSPEILPRCYHPDNKPVKCAEIPNGLIFTAAPEEKNGIQKSMAITMTADSSEIEIVHRITNLGKWEIELAPWAITMLAPGGTAILPITGPDTGKLPNRNLVMWPYTNMGDPRLTFSRDCILVKQQTESKPLKLGYFNDSGFAVYFNKNQAFFKYFDVNEADYPDSGCNFEMYTDANFLESETLGPLELLEPGETTLHAERWEIFAESDIPKNEAEATEIIGRHIEIEE